jgi:hypothetical protein
VKRNLRKIGERKGERGVRVERRKREKFFNLRERKR